jgi:hypothetical protein
LIKRSLEIEIQRRGSRGAVFGRVRVESGLKPFMPNSASSSLELHCNSSTRLGLAEVVSCDFYTCLYCICQGTKLHMRASVKSYLWFYS